MDGAAPAPGRRQPYSLERRMARMAYLFLTPTLVYFALFYGLPIALDATASCRSRVGVSAGASAPEILVEDGARATRLGAKVAEVPIEFKPRTSGRSKLKFRDEKEFLLFALKNMF